MKTPVTVGDAKGQQCKNCGSHDDTTVNAHANKIKYGKGKAIKCHDALTAWLCYRCHKWLDQGFGKDPSGIYDDTAADKFLMWMNAFILTTMARYDLDMVRVNPKPNPQHVIPKILARR